MKPNRTNRCYAIVGTTSSGKTKRALTLAESLIEHFRGADLISVDSRQVYKGLEVLTGADVPDDWSQKTIVDLPHPFFEHPTKPIALHGISIREADEDWSMGQFVQFAREVMQWSWSNQRVPILIGGAGLYHRFLFSGDQTIQLAQDSSVRSRAEVMSVEQLQAWLKQVNHDRLQQMNESDRANPRRLVRAIEVELAEKSADTTESSTESQWSQVHCETELLTLPLDQLEANIAQRVRERFTTGAVDEVKQLLALDLPSGRPVMTTLGVPEIRQFLAGEISAEECQALWSLHEFQYAKRQLTWWKSQKNLL